MEKDVILLCPSLCLQALQRCLVRWPRNNMLTKAKPAIPFISQVGVVFSASQMNEQRPWRFCGLSGVTQLVLEAPLEPRCQDQQLRVFGVH